MYHPGVLSPFQVSDVQAAQIQEIFNLFDTDGGGTIDPQELDIAMVALGFQTADQQQRKRKDPKTMEIVATIASDGEVSLEEFTTLMTGAILGRNPMEEVHTVFAALSRSNGQRENDGLVTLEKLRKVCQDFKVPKHSLLIHSTSAPSPNISYQSPQSPLQKVSILTDPSNSSCVLDSKTLFLELSLTQA